MGISVLNNLSVNIQCSKLDYFHNVITINKKLVLIILSVHIAGLIIFTM